MYKIMTICLLVSKVFFVIDTCNFCMLTLYISVQEVQTSILYMIYITSSQVYGELLLENCDARSMIIMFRYVLYHIKRPSQCSDILKSKSK